MERDFKGIWIPKELWLTIGLTDIEKLFFVEIDSLDKEPKHCYAGNAHFANLFDRTESRCSQIIKSLEEKGWVIIAYEKEGTRIISRTMRSVDKSKDGPFRKLNRTIKYIKPYRLENAKESNTYNQTTPTSVEVGLVPPSEQLYTFARIYLEKGQQKRFVMVMVGDVLNDSEILMVGDALEILAAKSQHEGLTADDAIAYCKKSLINRRQTLKTLFPKP